MLHIAAAQPPVTSLSHACKTDPKRTPAKILPRTGYCCSTPSAQHHLHKASSKKIGSAGESCNFSIVLKNTIRNRPRDFPMPFSFSSRINARGRVNQILGSEFRGGESRPPSLPHKRRCILHGGHPWDLPRQRTERTMPVHERSWASIRGL